jgi:hypothetical protein
VFCDEPSVFGFAWISGSTLGGEWAPFPIARRSESRILKVASWLDRFKNVELVGEAIACVSQAR